MTVFVREDVRIYLCRELLVEAARKFPCSRESHVTFRKPDGIDPEATCQRCGGRNAVWHAPNDLWNAVMRGGDRGAADEWGIVCPLCFAEVAEAKGVVVLGVWHWEPDA